MCTCMYVLACVFVHYLWILVTYENSTHKCELTLCVQEASMGIYAITEKLYSSYLCTFQCAIDHSHVSFATELLQKYQYIPYVSICMYMIDLNWSHVSVWKQCIDCVINYVYASRLCVFCTWKYTCMFSCVSDKVYFSISSTSSNIDSDTSTDSDGSSSSSSSESHSSDEAKKSKQSLLLKISHLPNRSG